ncbi:DUF7344 domain-containing protein [Haladaptatus salinisoli]|uniref:DUF7344 domain-containing protein n=1 Tax=Haladaptatus salinisoli TaxID=2884876 RepID=UPI001D0B1486|nr:hypothetical protein [Haladaptatus salinisoli]
MTHNERRDRTTILSNPKIQEILAVLEGVSRPLHVDELAEWLVKQNETVMSSDEYEHHFKRERITLHHNHLPKLADNEFIDYNRETNTITVLNDTTANIDWFEGDMFEELLARFLTDRQSDGNPIGILEGRQTIIEYGRQLADEAEEELFCMYVSTDLLEEKCLCHAEDAIARDVEIYLGSRNPDVRDLTRKHLPEATFWEPQRGWLNAPLGYPKVGRLVLVDRQKVMLAILDEPNSNARYPEETAMVGEGEENPLVVLTRELLGPRLNHLDYQSADSQKELYS